MVGFAPGGGSPSQLNKFFEEPPAQLSAPGLTAALSGSIFLSFARHGPLSTAAVFANMAMQFSGRSLISGAAPISGRSVFGTVSGGAGSFAARIAGRLLAATEARTQVGGAAGIAGA